jgi:hypothetical protein
VDQFVATFVAEVNAANSQRSNRQALLAQQKAKVERQIRNMLELIKEGHGTPGMVAELRVTEHRLEELSGQISAEDQPETVPVLHPNLPELYRRRVEALEVSLADPSYPSGEPHLPFRVKPLSSILMDDLKVAHKYGGR